MIHEKDYNSLVALTEDGIQVLGLHNKEPLSSWAGQVSREDSVFKIGTVSKTHKEYPGYMLIEENQSGYTVLNNYIDPEDGISECYPFHTNAKTKGRIIKNLILAIENHQLIITDKFTYECMLYYQHGTVPGTYSAPEGYYDDPVIALALAWEALLRNGGIELVFDRVKGKEHKDEIHRLKMDNINDPVGPMIGLRESENIESLIEGLPTPEIERDYGDINEMY